MKSRDSETAIKAIETRYKGCRFRSRLEARWAVFFDVLGVPWDYEPQGFLITDHSKECGDLRPYLPDFFLPLTETWCEVKGSADHIDWQLLADAIDWGGGLPGVCESFDTARGLLILGPVPAPCQMAVQHPILQHSKGGWVHLATFIPGGLTIDTRFAQYFDASWGEQSELAKVVTEWLPGMMHDDYMHPLVAEAYRAARSARFEHGDRP